MFAASDPSVGAAHPDTAATVGQGGGRLPRPVSPNRDGVEADDFQTDCLRLCALLETDET